MEFGLNHHLLLRKWEEQHGCGMAAWLEQRAVQRENLTTIKAGALRVAQEKAQAVAAKWLLPAPQLEMVGRVFTVGTERYAFTVFANDRPEWAIRAVRLSDARLVNFHADRWPAIEAQIKVRTRRRAVA